MQDMNTDEDQQKRGILRDREFQLGCFGWFLLNALFLAALVFMTRFISAIDFRSIRSTLSALAFAANLGALIYFAFKRPRVAGGMLAAFGIALALVIVAGIIFLIACFTSF